MVMFVSLRMAKSTGGVLSAPMPFPSRLRARGRVASECRKFYGPRKDVFGKGQKGAPILDAGGTACKGVEGKCVRKWALTQKQTLGVAHLSEVTALPLSASHSLVIPLTV